MTYQIIIKPTYNIAFYSKFLDMCAIELVAVLESQGVVPKQVFASDNNKGQIMTFEVEQALEKKVLVKIWQLSFFYMLFKVLEDGSLKALDMDYKPDFGDDLSVRMKYNGKTNEVITRMMINLALASSDFANVPHPRLLDPLCGRGTTLFEGMISGYDVYGVDKNQKSIAEMGTYITRYVKEARFKHTNKRGKLITKGEHIGDLFELHYAKEKKDFKSGCLRELKVLRGETHNFVGAFRQNHMHLIVADLPYSIQHRGKDGKEGIADLLEKGLKAWTPFLKKGGGVAISWNTYTDKRELFTSIFQNNGYEVICTKGLANLEHRVAQAITRDIIIARKVE